MTSIRSRLLSGSLALLLALGTPSAALAAGPSGPDSPGESAGLLEITVPDYTPGPGLQAGDVSQIQAGGLYTLIVLPARTAAQSSVPKALTSDLLLSSDPLFVGSAVAEADGKVTFTGIRLRTAESAVYYVTGPGLTTPLAEATGLSVSAAGSVVRKLGSDSSPIVGATVSLEDETTHYAYRNSVSTTAGGSFYFDRLSPGKYYLHVEKPGYLPSTSSAAFELLDDETYMLPTYDLSPYIGDVNNDGVRDLSDLTGLLACYGQPLPTGGGLTPDLNEDGAANIADVALYLTAASAAGELTLGVGTPADAANSSLAFRDSVLADSSDHALTLSLDHGGYAPLTFTAASVSLTFRSDYIQPINQNGGAVAPGSASTNCLVPKAGVTASDVRWTQNGDLATLSFSLSCAKPTALTDLVELRYRPAPGKTTEDFFQGVFSLDHIAAQVGGATVLTDCALEYPNSAPLELTSISIDLDQTSFTIPAAGHTLVLPLSATGHKDDVNYSDLSGVTWALSEGVSGVFIADRLLTITSEATAGTFALTASRGGVTSLPLSITLENAPSVPTAILITREGLEDGSDADALSASAGAAFSVSYAAQVIDQYGAPMAGQTVAWSLSGAPAGIAVSQDGALTAAAGLPAGTYPFTLLASLDGLRAVVNVTLTLEPSLDRLVLSGPAAAQIPSGAGTLTLSYLISALDAQGFVIPTPGLDLTFVVLPLEGSDETPVGVHADVDMSGSLTVTVGSEAQSGDYTLRASAGDLSADFTLTLRAPAEQSSSTPVRAALLHQGDIAASLSLTFYEAKGGSESALYPVLFNENGAQVTPDRQSWSWTTDGLPTEADSHAPSYLVHSDHLELDVSRALPGVYFFTVTATEAHSGLSVSLPVEITILPKNIALRMDVPDQLSIPTSGSLNYTVGLTCLDANDAIVTPPGLVSWSVTGAEDSVSPAGVNIQDGVLTVSAAAKPGQIRLQVQCASFPEYDNLALASTDKLVTLVPADDEKVLALRRDGQLLSGGVDAAACKEGAALTLTYTPVLLDRATGQVTELTEGVTWMGVEGVFALDEHADPGVHTVPITAFYDGRSVSLTAQITVYPQITNLYIDFDEGDSDPYANRYSFPVPSQAAKTYHGTLMAQIRRGGANQYLPLSQLGLTDYDLDIYTVLNGVYLSYDKSTGRVALTIEPLASSNSMANPGPSDSEIRYLGIELRYYPGEDILDLTQSFYLTKENATASAAVLRQGKGTGSSFVFETTRAETSLTASPGVLSDCFALELLDQYGAAITDQTVTWTLSGSPTSGSTHLITLLDPGEAVLKSYPLYQSLRRLRISPDTPAGTYRLTLTASAAGFSRSILINMEIDQSQPLETFYLTGPDMAVIPKWYSQYNSSATNSEQRTLSYFAVAQDAHGNELDAALCDFVWAVTNDEGKEVPGVTVRFDAKNPATSTVTVDRFARPTTVTENNQQVTKPLHVTVTVTPKAGGDPSSSETLLSLIRGNLVPTLMTVNGPSSIKLDLPKADASNPNPTYPGASKDYTFTLFNQYNDEVSDWDARKVEWSWNEKTLPSYVSITKKTDRDGHRYVTLSVTNPKRDTRATVTLTASITFPEASTTSGEAIVYRSFPVTITVGNPSGGGGGGGLLPEEEVTASTVTPSTSKSGTTGAATLSAEEVDTLSKTTATGTLTIAPKNTSGLTSITVTFPGSLVKDLRAKTQNNSLRIQTAIGTVTIPNNVLASFSNSGNVSITIRNQDSALAVTFTSNGRQLATLSGGSATLSAPVKGDTVTAVSGGVSQDVLKKTVISNGTLTVSLTGSAELTVGYKPQQKVFSDVHDHWAKSAIDFVVERGLFQGTSETTFSPNGNMTRSMVVTVLHRLENTPSVSAANLFADVPSGVWYTDAVVWANSNGIVQGTGDGFLPENPVTREQLATILYRYMKSQGHDVTKRSALGSFSDSASVSSWAQEAMEWAVAAGVLNGKSGGLLDPGGNASRAEVATMLERLVRLISPSV